MPDRWSLQWPPGGDMGMRRSEEGQWVLWDDAVAMVEAERLRIRASIEALPRYAPGWPWGHVGRSFSGHPLEDDCPCEKAPCGLVVWGSNEDCPQHGVKMGKTIRQGHFEADCPALRGASTGTEDR